MARNNYKAYLCIKDGKLCVANHLVKKQFALVIFQKILVNRKINFLIGNLKQMNSLYK